MLDIETLERRLITLEKVVFELQHKLDSKPSSDNWLERLIGSISDDSAFLEALEYGREFRQSDKPIDDLGKES
ncbi:MAG: transferase hexapeptide repeat containing protein [Cyanobacteriota bacterium]|jgi:hypothetical protein